MKKVIPLAIVEKNLLVRKGIERAENFPSIGEIMTQSLLISAIWISPGDFETRAINQSSPQDFHPVGVL